MELVIGIDEAGRGAVLGPLVICGVTGDAGTREILWDLDIGDSKNYSPSEREELAVEIRRCAKDVGIVAVPPALIDRAVPLHQLNRLEAKVMAFLINRTDTDTAYIDAPGRIPPGLPDHQLAPGNFRRVIQQLVRSGVRIIAENRADERYPLVAAASILAKVERDHAITEIARTYDCDIGSGYPDRKTTAFLTGYYRAHRCFPGEMRMSWKTRHAIIRSVTERGLDDFGLDQEDSGE